MDDLTPSDAELLRGWAAGDGEAGNVLVARHFDALYGFLRLKLPGEIDDLVQQTFLACLASHDRFRAEGSFRAYLFAIARNLLFADLRRRLARPVPDLGASSLDALADDGALPSAVSRIAHTAEQVLLLRALRRMPLDDQIALELFYWKGLRAAEIGEVLEQSASAVRTRLQRARGRLESVVGELSQDARLVESTVDGFERWAASLAVQLPG